MSGLRSHSKQLCPKWSLHYSLSYPTCISQFSGDPRCPDLNCLASDRVRYDFVWLLLFIPNLCYTVFKRSKVSGLRLNPKSECSANVFRKRMSRPCFTVTLPVAGNYFVLVQCLQSPILMMFCVFRIWLARCCNFWGYDTGWLKANVLNAFPTSQ